MARTIADLCQGQIREVQGSAAGQHHVPAVVPDREHYLRVIGEKTASLIASSCRLGAILTDQGPEAKEAVTTYGWHLGMSFQLADDVVDIVSSSSESGKTPGTDLREGIRTLPVLLVLASPDRSPDSDRLRELLAGDLDDDERLAEALRLLRRHPAMDDAIAHLSRCVEQAREIAAELDPGPAREALTSLTEFVLARSG